MICDVDYMNSDIRNGYQAFLTFCPLEHGEK